MCLCTSLTYLLCRCMWKFVKLHFSNPLWFISCTTSPHRFIYVSKEGSDLLGLTSQEYDFCS